MNKMQRCTNILTKNLKKLTQLKDEEIANIVSSIPVVSYKKGTILLHQGSKPQASYYLLMGCIRQYASDENGKETTVTFYTEEQPINMFSFLDTNSVSYYSLACLEECLLVECYDIDEKASDNNLEEIKDMKYYMFERQFTDLQQDYTQFKIKSPKERFETLLKNRPDLFNRVPQHILANYLNITPETFSRFKKIYLKQS